MKEQGFYLPLFQPGILTIIAVEQILFYNPDRFPKKCKNRTGNIGKYCQADLLSVKEGGFAFS